jgi:hypothetical protein
MPSVSKKQHNFMAAVANNPKFAKKAGVSSAVGKEFLTADKGKTFKQGETMKKMNSGMMAMMAKKKPMAKKEMSAEMPMKKGGMAKKPAKKMMGGGMYAKGGGIESKGKTKGTMIKMKSGGKAC